MSRSPLWFIQIAELSWANLPVPHPDRCPYDTQAFKIKTGKIVLLIPNSSQGSGLAICPCPFSPVPHLHSHPPPPHHQNNSSNIHSQVFSAITGNCFLPFFLRKGTHSLSVNNWSDLSLEYSLSSQEKELFSGNVSKEKDVRAAATLPHF